MPLVSVIIPVYNLENYISNCIESILMQSYKNYELLIINDGSTDNSSNICDDYAAKDKRIRVLHQKNAGVSAARNLGLKKAIGKWICFVDGDDFLAENSFGKLITQAEISNPEILIAKSFIFENGKRTTERYPFDNSYLESPYGGIELIVKKSYKRSSVCGCLFRKEFLSQNNLLFPLGLLNSEDVIFMSLNHLYAKKIHFINLPFYLINEREGSASRSWTSERVFRMTDNLTFINQYSKDNPSLSNEQKAILELNKYEVVSTIFNKLYSCFSIGEFFKIIKILKKELPSKLNTLDIQVSKTKIKILNFSMIFYAFTVLINQSFRK